MSSQLSLFVFEFLQNDDEDMTYMYNAYLHKLITCFLSHPHAREKVCGNSFVS